MDALDLANSLSKDRGRTVDTLDPGLGLHSLRDTIRTLFDAAAAGAEPPSGGVAMLNRLARAPCLRWNDSGPSLADEDEASGAARTAIEVLASGRIRTCGNPRCIRFYLAEGRRAYCSATCANRTRVARHAAGHTPAPPSV